jgi:hypothetical protein
MTTTKKSGGKVCEDVGKLGNRQGRPQGNWDRHNFVSPLIGLNWTGI